MRLARKLALEQCVSSGQRSVTQAFQPAGSGDFPVASSLWQGRRHGNTGLESPVNPQAGKPALRGGGVFFRWQFPGWEVTVWAMSQTFKDHFSSVANRYADFRPHYPAELFDYLATIVPRKATVWDCACGNGQATVDLAARFERVIGTDASKEQIAPAKPNLRIEYRVAPAEQSGLPDKSAGLVTVAQALHWFQFERFYAEVKRVLAPHGVIAVWAYGINELEGETVNGLVQHFYAEVVGPYWPPERKLVEERYQTIPFPFAQITPPPPEFRMEARWTLEELLGYFSTWSATNRYIKATGKNPLEPLAAELEAVWGGPDRRRQVTWPLAVRVGLVE
jgi:ubiquinone/menaquinone biosynthesis C-methylase UbiE